MFCKPRSLLLSLVYVLNVYKITVHFAMSFNGYEHSSAIHRGKKSVAVNMIIFKKKKK